MHLCQASYQPLVSPTFITYGRVASRAGKVGKHVVFRKKARKAGKHIPYSLWSTGKAGKCFLEL